MNMSRDESSQMLPLQCIESIVTISNGNSNEILSTSAPTGRSHLWMNFGSFSHQPSTSMINLPSNGKDCTMVATCTPPSLNSPNAQNGRISLIMYSFDGKKRGSVYIKRSRRSESYKIVSLVSVGDTSALLLAVDALGKLHYCNLAPVGANAKERRLSLTEIGTTDDIEHMMFMNTLTARIEASSQLDGSIQGTLSSTQCNPSPTPTKTNRKRKKYSSTVMSESNISASSHGVYVVASCLNAPMPSDGGPILMYLSKNGSNPKQYQCSASTTIPLDHTWGQLKCIIFLSQEQCGKLWGAITSVFTKKESETSNDAGVILMGFQDGSLRALKFYRQAEKNGTADVTLQTSRVAALLAGRGQAPLMSLQLISTPSSSDDSAFLACCRENGSVIIISSTSIHQQSIPCQSRVVATRIINCEHSASNVELAFVEIHDTGRSFLHSAAFRVDNGSVRDWKDSIVELPLLCARSLSTPPVRHKWNPFGCMFATSQCNGDLTVSKFKSDVRSQGEEDVFPKDKKSAILAYLRTNSNTPNKQIIQRAPRQKLSTHESLMKKLLFAASNNINPFITNTTNNRTSLAILEALKEIRNAVRVSSFLIGKDNVTPSIFDGSKVSFMKSWSFAVHYIHKHPASSMSGPICYRIAGRGNTYTKVFYGGTVHSVAEDESKSDKSSDKHIRVLSTRSNKMVIGSLQMCYSHNSKTWCKAESIADSSPSSKVAAASKCSSLVHLFLIQQ